MLRDDLTDAFSAVADIHGEGEVGAEERSNVGGEPSAAEPNIGHDEDAGARGQLEGFMKIPVQRLRVEKQLQNNVKDVCLHCLQMRIRAAGAPGRTSNCTGEARHRKKDCHQIEQKLLKERK
jgi:hypothetical protein